MLWQAIVEALLPNVGAIVTPLCTLIGLSLWHRVALKKAAMKAAREVVDSDRPPAGPLGDDAGGFDTDGTTQVEQLLKQHALSAKIITRHDRRVVAKEALREVRASLRPKKP